MIKKLSILLLFLSLPFLLAAQGGGLTKSGGDKRYLKLDCSNDPLTDNLTIHGNLTLGDGTAVDRSIIFDSSANDGTITFDESGNDFEFGDSDINTTGIVRVEHLESSDDIDVNDWIAVGDTIAVNSSLYIQDGSITDTDGAISFGNENLTTTGTVQAETIQIGAVGATLSPLAVGNIEFTPTAADINPILAFIGTTYQGAFAWMEDEDYFLYFDDIILNDTENLYFYDTAISINSATDGHLDLTADVSVDLNTPLLACGASDITTTGNITGANLIISDGGTIGSASDTDVMTIDASGNTTFTVFPITPSAAPDADYEVANKKYVDDNATSVSFGTEDQIPYTNAATDDFNYGNLTYDGTNLEVSQADPEIRITDTGDSNYARITRTDTDGKVTMYNTVYEPPFGNSLVFDGTNERVDVDDDATLTPTGGLTISAWIYINSVSWADRTAIISKWGAQRGYLFALGVNNTADKTTPGFQCSSQTGSYVGRETLGTTALVVDTWYHLVVKWETDHQEIWVNGVEETDDTNAAISDTIANDNNSLRIAWHEPENNYFNGIIDQVAIWEEFGSDNDVADLYNGGDGMEFDTSTTWPTDGGTMGTNLIAYWKLDETSGISAADSSANTNTGTTQNMEDADWQTGKVVVSGGADKEIVVFSSEDGTAANEEGIVIGGHENGRTIIDGQTTKFYIGGAEIADIDANGDWTIDNDLTITTNLTSSGTSSFVGDSTFDTTTLFVDSAGNEVGIGTITPTDPLNVISDTDHVAIRIEENTGGEEWRIGVNADGDLIFYDSGTASAERTMILADAGMVTIADQLLVWDTDFPVIRAQRRQDADSMWSTFGCEAKNTGDAGDGYGAALHFQFIDTGGTFNLGDIGMIRDGADETGAIIFQNYVAGTPTESMRIDGNLDVGIGDTSPDYPLEILDTNNPQFCISHTDTVDYTTFYVDGDGEFFIMPTPSRSIILGDGNDGDNAFKFWSDTSTYLLHHDEDNSALKLSANDATNYTQFGANGDQTFVGTAGFYPRKITQADTPAAGTGATQIDTDELLIWDDSDNAEVWLVFNDATNVVKVKLGP